MLYTPNLKLPQYEDNDPTSYLTTYNETMELIDEGVGRNTTDITKAQTDISTLENQMTTSNESITQLQTDVSNNTETLTGYNARLVGAEQNITSLQSVTMELNEKITDVSNLAGTRYNGVLSANEETIAITIGDYTNDTLVDAYTSIYGVNPLTIELRAASNGQPNLCVMTFEPQTEDMNVSVVLSN